LVAYLVEFNTRFLISQIQSPSFLMNGTDWKSVAIPSPYVEELRAYIQEDTKKQLGKLTLLHQLLPGSLPLFGELLRQEIRKLYAFEEYLQTQAKNTKRNVAELMKQGLIDFKEMLQGQKAQAKTLLQTLKLKPQTKEIWLSPCAQWIWRTYLLHPKSYQCAERTSTKKLVLPLWDLGRDIKVPLFKSVSCVLGHWNIFNDFNLEGDAIRNWDFAQKILSQRDVYQFDCYLERICCGFVNFVEIVRDNPGMSFKPGLDVDLVWHTYMLQADVYARETKKVFGEILDHQTSSTQKESQDKKQPTLKFCQERICRFQMHQIGTSLRFAIQKEVQGLLLTIFPREIYDIIIICFGHNMECQERMDDYANRIVNVLYANSSCMKTEEGDVLTLTYSCFLLLWSQMFQDEIFAPEFGGGFGAKIVFEQANHVYKERYRKTVEYVYERDAKNKIVEMIRIKQWHEMENQNNKERTQLQNDLCRCCAPELYRGELELLLICK
jgi:hypothetical protein